MSVEETFYAKSYPRDGPASLKKTFTQPADILVTGTDFCQIHRITRVGPIRLSGCRGLSFCGRGGRSIVAASGVKMRTDMVPWEKTVLSQTPSGQVVVAGSGREESADLRSMRMWGFSHRVCRRFRR